jgi:hypothetical protein
MTHARAYRARYTERDHRVADATDAILLRQGVTPIACGNGPVSPRAHAEALLRSAELTLRLDLREMARLVVAGRFIEAAHWNTIVDEDESEVERARVRLATIGDVP